MDIKKLVPHVLLLLTLWSCNLNDESDYSNPGYDNTVYDNQFLIMIYMAADNNLDPYAIEDINEMEGVNLSDKSIKVVVLLDRSSSGSWNDTKMYEIKNDNDSNTINSPLISTEFTNIESNTGDSSLLRNFIKYSLDRYNPQKTMLIVWNHGEGILGSCYDETDSDYLTLKELKDSVFGYNLDVIGFDACVMGMIEVAYQLRDSCKFLILSQDDIPSSGWNYSEILKSIKYSDLSSKTVTKIVIETYNYNILSAVETSYISKINNLLNNLIGSLNSSETNMLLSNRPNCMDFNNGEQVDLLELFSVLNYKIEFDLFKKSLDSGVVFSNRNISLINCCGLSIYYPLNLYKYNFDLYANIDIEFFHDSLWKSILEEGTYM